MNSKLAHNIESKTLNTMFTKKVLILIFFIGFTLRLVSSLDPELHEWDEKYHALVSKNLLENPLAPKLVKSNIIELDYKDWTTNNIWLHKPPLTTLIIGASYKLFGVSVFATRIPSIITGSLLILLMFYIAKYFFSENIGLLAGFIYCINGFMIEQQSGRITTDHVDSLLLFWICLYIATTIYFVQKKSLNLTLLLGILLACGILTKWLLMMMVIPIFLGICYIEKFSLKEIIKACFIQSTIALLICLPWHLHCYIHFPKEYLWELNYNSKHLYKVIENHSGSSLFYINKMRIIFNELIYLPILFSLYQITQKNPNLKLIILLLWVFGPLIFFSLIKTKMASYLIISSPAYFILSAYFIDYLLFTTKMIKVFRYSIIFAFIALSIRYCIERLKPLELNLNFDALSSLDSKQSSDSTIIFNDSRYIHTMFHTNCISAYPFKPDTQIIQKLNYQGYKVIVK